MPGTSFVFMQPDSEDWSEIGIEAHGGPPTTPDGSVDTAQDVAVSAMSPDSISGRGLAIAQFGVHRSVLIMALQIPCMGMPCPQG